MTEVEGQVLSEEEEERRDAEDQARRRVALAQIRQYPDPVLRLRAHEVVDFDDELVRLAERMKALMRDAHGVGLAATQVGVLRRLFVFAPAEEDEPRVLVNPIVAKRSKSVETDVEGCLSLGPVRVPVERAQEIVLDAQDLAGEPLRLQLEGIDARVAQHELDHLDGVLMIQRTDVASRRDALGILRPQPVIGVG